MNGGAELGSSTAPVRLPQLKEFTTSSGLKVILASRAPLPLVTLHLVVQAGSSADPPGKYGLADFTASLLRRGTKRRSADQINEAVEFYGGSLACFTEEDFLSIRITSPSEQLQRMLEVLGELAREPSFPEKEVALARSRQLAQIANDLDDPALLADRALLKAVWGPHPYGHDVVGTSRHVGRLHRQDAVLFHRGKIGSGLCLLIVVGLADLREVKATAERAFRGWPFGPPRPLQIPGLERPFMFRQTLLVDKPEQTQSQVRIGALAFPQGHPDFFPATVMNTVLGGSFNSRLMQAIRVNRGLSYGVSSGFDRLLGGGTFSVSTFTKTETTRAIIDVALGELAKMRLRGPSEEEVAAAKRYLAGLYPLGIETNEAVAGAIAEMRLYRLGDDWVERFRERLFAVTVEEAARMAKKYLFRKPPTLAIVGSAHLLRGQLAGLGKLRVARPSELK
jgi:zinc protease